MIKQTDTFVIVTDNMNPSADGAGILPKPLSIAVAPY
jgi:hypothetical protein